MSSNREQQVTRFVLTRRHVPQVIYECLYRTFHEDTESTVPIHMSYLNVSVDYPGNMRRVPQVIYECLHRTVHEDRESKVPVLIPYLNLSVDYPDNMVMRTIGTR